MKHYDLIIPVGKSCRPAGNLRDFGVYKYGLPFDWKVFSLEAFLHVLETDFADYFASVEPVEGSPVFLGDTIGVRDRINDILSAHDFMVDEDIEDQRVQMVNANRKAGRFMMKRIRKAKHVLLLSGRTDESQEELKDFLIRFSKLFPEPDITLLNIRHKGELPTDVYEETFSWSKGKLHFDDYAANEVNDSVELDQGGWKGNQRQWYAILSRYIPLEPAKPEWQPRSLK